MNLLDTAGGQLKENQYDANTRGSYHDPTRTQTDGSETWPPATKGAAMKSRNPHL